MKWKETRMNDMDTDKGERNENQPLRNEGEAIAIAMACTLVLLYYCERAKNRNR